MNHVKRKAERRYEIWDRLLQLLDMRQQIQWQLQLKDPESKKGGVLIMLETVILIVGHAVVDLIAYIAESEEQDEVIERTVEVR